MGKINFDNYEIYFITGSQHLYGEDTLKQVAKNSQAIVEYFNQNSTIPIKIKWIPTVKSSNEIVDAILDANANKNCIGIITWMHTFSPAKMWINGLKLLQKPMLHLNTQFNKDLPWSTIDMDFMNLNQAAHGDREFGFICTRMNIARKVVNGFYQSERVINSIAIWSRVCAAWCDSQSMKIARIGDNMREVAVTEGNKVTAQILFGYSVNGFGIGDVLPYIEKVTEAEVQELVEEYFKLYDVPNSDEKSMISIREAARQEIGLKAFLDAGDFSGFTTTFENLYGLHQLPGLASQRLMSMGYGFGAEGDWKTAALLRTLKVMAHGLEGGVSFMEDYTYHFGEDKELVLGSHMLEVCPSIAKSKPTLEVHPLGIGGKADPARLVFTANTGMAINSTMIDLGEKYRLISNVVEVVDSKEDLPNLPVASSLWEPKPNLAEGAKLWIEAGGTHHNISTTCLNLEYMEDYARIAKVELVVIK